MYIPPAFKSEDPATLHAFIKRHAFATLVTATDTEPFVSHVPLLLTVESGQSATLLGHFAKPNPHWTLDHRRYASVAVFHGPHAYISPSWYSGQSPAVPTWNYAVVHAHGHLTILEDAGRTRDIIDRLVATYESGRARPWVNNLSEEMNAKLLSGIVGFEMLVDRFEGKFKLSQNRSAEDQAGAVTGLEAAGDPDSLRVAALMKDLRNH